MSESLWEKCLVRLKHDIAPDQFNNWIRPLQNLEEPERLVLLAPNRFVQDWVRDHYQEKIAEIIEHLAPGHGAKLHLAVGSRDGGRHATTTDEKPFKATAPTISKAGSTPSPVHKRDRNRGLAAQFTFENFVEGKCNQLGRAAAMQVAENPGNAYNPLYIYGGVGLGKTHLMHAVGNEIIRKSPDAKVVYLHSERFVNDMVSALQHNAINKFKTFYRSVDALLIDDIQFFIGKERSQEEFFHTFNALLEEQQQVILTCDRFPRSVEGIEERLKSRFGWGLTVAMEPPELETRVAILKSKAAVAGVELPHDVAFFVAKRVKTNIRELEGALRRVIANSKFTGKPISLEFTREALKDLLALQEKLITIENIQKTVAEYYKLRVSDLVSKRRSRSIARPRQVAMALAKEVTNHSLPEIGDAFGGRDHTTVLHACRKVRELKETDESIQMDYRILLRTLSS